MLTPLPDLLNSISAAGVSLEELAVLANQALDAGGLAIDDGRTASRLDGRTIRFYQSLGVIPKPEYEGRRARYSREHLIRVVAAKRLQSEGYSLAQIQAALPARTFDDLASTLVRLEPARLPAPPSGAAPVRLASFQLAPGVTVLIDPQLVPDPQRIADALARTARSESTTRTNGETR